MNFVIQSVQQYQYTFYSYLQCYEVTGFLLLKPRKTSQNRNDSEHQYILVYLLHPGLLNI